MDYEFLHFFLPKESPTVKLSNSKAHSKLYVTPSELIQRAWENLVYEIDTKKSL